MVSTMHVFLPYITLIFVIVRCLTGMSDVYVGEGVGVFIDVRLLSVLFPYDVFLLLSTSSTY